jgi:hypothetical protein
MHQLVGMQAALHERFHFAGARKRNGFCRGGMAVLRSNDLVIFDVDALRRGD